MGVGISDHEIAIILITPVILGRALAVPQQDADRLGACARSRRTRTPAISAGINVTALYALAFGHRGRMLAALAGIFFGGFKFMGPTMGAEPLSKALVVVIFGGVANITGPILAAYIIGLFEAVSTYFIGFYWTPALLFLVLIAVLMVRPEGLFAQKSRGLA